MVTFVDQKKAKQRQKSDVREIRRSERSLQIRVDSADESASTIDAVLSTEQAVQMWDWSSYERMDEVLLASGREADKTIPMLDSHRRWSLDDVYGHMSNIRTEGTDTIVTCNFDKDDENAMKAFRKYKNGHCRALSVGYTVLRYVDIGPGQTATVSGRKFTADDKRKMRVVTKWRAEEGSLVVIGADSKAKVRGCRGIDGLSSEVTDEEAAYLSKREESRVRRQQRSQEEPKPSDTVTTTIEETSSIATLSEPLRSSPTVVINVTNGEVRTGESTTGSTDPGTEVPVVGTVSQEVPAEAGGERERTGSMTTTVADQSAAPEVDVEKIRSDARNEGIRLERERQTQIRELAGDDVSPECLQSCLDDPNCTLDSARTKFLADIRAGRQVSRPVGTDSPAPHGSHGGSGARDKPAQIDVLTAAVALRLGGENVAKMLPFISFNPRSGQLRMKRMTTQVTEEQKRAHERIVNEAYKFESLASIDVCQDAMRASGIEFDTRDYDEIAVRAFSTPAVSTIYTQTMGALLLSNLAELGDSTQGWCREMDVKNFKPQELHRIEGGRLKKRNRGETARQASFADTMESFRIAEYSNTLVIDRQDLIDDDLNAWMTTMDEYARGVNDVRPSLVYGFLATNAALATDGVTLFHADHSNLITGSALAAATLQTAITTLASARGAGGLPLNLRNCVLVTSETLSFTADQLVSSAEIREAAAANGTMNPLKLRNVATRSDSRLNIGFTNPSTDIAVAGAGTTWYLAAAGGAYGIQVGYRTGSNRMPMMSTKPLTAPGQYGLAMDVQFDIGVGVQSYQGIVKATA